MTNCYLWRQEPTLSSEPILTIKHRLLEEGDCVCEVAVFKLENEKYLYIRYVSDSKNDNNIGFTDLEEFDKEAEAVRLYNETVGD